MLGLFYWGHYSSRTVLTVIRKRAYFWIAFILIFAIMIVTAIWPLRFQAYSFIIGFVALELLITVRFLYGKLSEKQLDEIDESPLDSWKIRDGFFKKL